MSDLELVLPFDTDEPDFARGFEAGMLWERMKSEHRIDATVHASNTEMVMRIAEAQGFTFRAEDIDETWTNVELSR